MIHIFGDSFGDGYIPGIASSYNSDHTIWHAILAEKLQTTSKTHAVGGSSLEFTFEQFYRNCDKFSKNDIVIIILTSSSRHYFFPHWPSAGSLARFTDTTLFPKHMVNERRAWKEFELFLNTNNENLKEIHTINFLYAVQEYTRNLGLHTIILNAFNNTFNNKITEKKFPNLHVAKGYLLEVSLKELVSLNDNNKIKFAQTDTRINHLSICNHEILADKILQNLHNKQGIDLTTNFRENFLTI